MGGEDEKRNGERMARRGKDNEEVEEGANRKYHGGVVIEKQR
jgi:hypothetical protein